MPLAGRAAICVHLALLPSARPDGLGAVFCRSRHAGRRRLGLGRAGRRGRLCWVCQAWSSRRHAWRSALLLAAYVYRKLGGATGDTLGAACEIVEIVPALGLALWPLDLVR